MDEVFLKINGKTHYLWRAVDQEGNVLDILVQRRRPLNAFGRVQLILTELVQAAPQPASPLVRLVQVGLV